MASKSLALTTTRFSVELADLSKISDHLLAAKSLQRPSASALALEHFDNDAHDLWRPTHLAGFTQWFVEQRQTLAGDQALHALRTAQKITAKIQADREEKTPHSLFVALQEWEGYVQEINEAEGGFSARLFDVTSPDDEHEIAEFDLTEVAADDKELVRVGGIFRWVIGYRTFETGRTEKSSSLIFRRLPAWRKEALARSREEARQLANAIQWE